MKYLLRFIPRIGISKGGNRILRGNKKAIKEAYALAWASGGCDFEVYRRIKGSWVRVAIPSSWSREARAAMQQIADNLAQHYNIVGVTRQ